MTLTERHKVTLARSSVRARGQLVVPLMP